MLFRSRKKREAPAAPEAAQGGVATADLPTLQAEIAELTRLNRESPDGDREQRLVELRHMAGIGLLESARGGASFPEPAFELVVRERLHAPKMPRVAPERRAVTLGAGRGTRRVPGDTRERQRRPEARSLSDLRTSG